MKNLFSILALLLCFTLSSCNYGKPLSAPTIKQESFSEGSSEGIDSFGEPRATIETIRREREQSMSIRDVGEKNIPMEPCFSNLGDGYDPVRAAICERVNLERMSRGFNELYLTVKSSEAAQYHAADMFNKRYIGHTNYEDQRVRERLLMVGADFSAWGENVAYGDRRADGVMDGWMNSSGHRQNILNSRFGRLGVGYIDGFWAQVFTD